jgi:hypothetical protein
MLELGIWSFTTTSEATPYSILRHPHKIDFPFDGSAGKFPANLVDPVNPVLCPAIKDIR